MKTFAKQNNLGNELTEAFRSAVRKMILNDHQNEQSVEKYIADNLSDLKDHPALTDSQRAAIHGMIVNRIIESDQQEREEKYEGTNVYVLPSHFIPVAYGGEEQPCENSWGLDGEFFGLSVTKEHVFKDIDPAYESIFMFDDLYCSLVQICDREDTMEYERSVLKGIMSVRGEKLLNILDQEAIEQSVEVRPTLGAISISKRL